MRITIHQPVFMPWLGLFNKINNSDVFVVLDHVENNPKDAAFWGRRVKMLISKNEKWVSVPLKKPAEKTSIGVPIHQMEINTALAKELRKSYSSIEQSYQKYPFFKEVFPIIQQYFETDEPLLMKRNMEFFKSMFEKLNINKQIVYSSELNCQKKATELLVEILTGLNATTYVAGGGADGYQQDELFTANNIKLEYNRFEHPVYPQLNTEAFIPGLSIIDCLMNVGFEETEKLCKAE